MYTSPVSSPIGIQGRNEREDKLKERVFKTITEQKDEESERDSTQDLWEPRTPEDEKDLENMLEEIRIHPNLPKKSYPKEPQFKPGTSAETRLQVLQRFISSFEYNHTTEKFFQIRKDLGMKRIISTAKDVINESLPIKCIEAVFLACYLTRNMEDLVRIPVRFQTKLENGNIYRHIIMAVGNQGKWGALGLSRKSTLMYKDLDYKSLSALILDYKSSYEECGHSIDHVGLGLPFAHEIHSMLPIHWRALMLRTNNANWTKVTESIDLYWNKIDKIERQVSTYGSFPASWVNGEDLVPANNNGKKSEPSGIRSPIASAQEKIDIESKNQDVNETDKGDNDKLVNERGWRSWSPILIPQPPMELKLPPTTIQIPTVDNKVLEVPLPWIDPKYKDEELNSDLETLEAGVKCGEHISPASEE